MNWIVTLIIGGLVGWLASIIMKTNAQMGILANVVVGIIGSLIGHAVADAMGLATRDNAMMGWLMAILGSILLIGILRALGFFRTPAAPLPR